MSWHLHSQMQPISHLLEFWFYLVLIDSWTPKYEHWALQVGYAREHLAAGQQNIREQQVQGPSQFLNKQISSVSSRFHQISSASWFHLFLCSYRPWQEWHNLPVGSWAWPQAIHSIVIHPIPYAPRRKWTGGHVPDPHRSVCHASPTTLWKTATCQQESNKISKGSRWRESAEWKTPNSVMFLVDSWLSPKTKNIKWYGIPHSRFFPFLKENPTSEILTGHFPSSIFLGGQKIYNCQLFGCANQAPMVLVSRCEEWILRRQPAWPHGKSELFGGPMGLGMVTMLNSLFCWVQKNIKSGQGTHTHTYKVDSLLLSFSPVPFQC